MPRGPESTRRDLNRLLAQVVDAEQNLLDVLEKFERADRRTSAPSRTDERFPALGGRSRG